MRKTAGRMRWNPALVFRMAGTASVTQKLLVKCGFGMPAGCILSDLRRFVTGNTFFIGNTPERLVAGKAFILLFLMTFRQFARAYHGTRE